MRTYALLRYLPIGDKLKPTEQGTLQTKFKAFKTIDFHCKMSTL
jgi:hypothetical protein